MTNGGDLKDAPGTKQAQTKNPLGRLTRLGFTSAADCLLSVPKSFRDYTTPVRAYSSAAYRQKNYFALKILSMSRHDREGNVILTWEGTHQLRVELLDADGKQARATIFGNVWPWKNVASGDDVCVYGELNTWFGHLRIDQVDLIPVTARGKVVPTYAGKPGQVSGDLLAKGIASALALQEQAASALLSRLDMDAGAFRRFTGVDSAATLLANLHRPPSVAAGMAACATAKQLCALELVRRAERLKQRACVAQSAIAIEARVVSTLIARLPFDLTHDQATAIAAIIDDLRSPVPMARLLSGDVNTGKTISFVVPAVAAYLAGAQVAILAPSQLLVGQISREIRSYFPEIPVNEVVSGSQIANGIVVGTTAVLAAAAKQNWVFDLVIADEQHKFSVAQKQALLHTHTNFLEATATIIPRTLAMVSYGGMDLSLLRQSPVEQNIETRIVEAAEADRVFAFVQKVMERGGQVAVIYPFVEDTDAGTAATPADDTHRAKRSVMEGFDRWNKAFPGRVGVIHGRMQESEQTETLDRLREHHIDILVSSTVIEVGLTIPALKLLIVVQPERLGLAQLHQLRGRVARRGGRGYVFLFVPEQITQEARERLQTLVECADGYALAERDMHVRGFGNVASDSDGQTGATRLLFWGAQLTPDDIEKTAAAWLAHKTTAHAPAAQDKVAA